MTMLHIADGNDYASCADNAQFDLASTDDLLFELYFKPTVTPSTLEAICWKAAHYSFFLAADLTVRFSAYHANDGTINVQSAVGDALSLNTGYYLGAVYDQSAGICSLYQAEEGAASASRVAQVTGINTAAGIADNGAASFYIGATVGAAQGYVGGVFGAIASGLDPSAASISTPTGYRTSDGNTKFSYKCNEGAGDPVNDEGTTAIDLTRKSGTEPAWSAGESPYFAAEGGGGAEIFFQQPYTIRRTRTF